MRVSTSVQVSCKLCENTFMVQPHRFLSGRGKFCSAKCRSTGIFTKEVRQKMSLARKNKPTGRSGNKCHFWKGGITEENKQIRMSLEYRKWRTSVFVRDGYKCVICNSVGGKLQADHIKSFSKHKDLRFELSNGRTLCIECHKKTDTYGGKSNRLQKVKTL